MLEIKQALVLSGLLVALSACGPKTTEEYIESAKKAQNKGDTNTAVIELKNAISNSPELLEARLQLANIYLMQSEYASAEKEYNRALELGADINDVVPNLIKLYYLTNEFDSAITTSNRYSLDSRDGQQRAELYSFLSKLQVTGTSDLLVPVKLNAPAKMLATGFQALSTGDTEQAIHLANSVPDSYTESSEAINLRGQAAYRIQNYEQAAIEFNELLTVFPNRHVIRFQLAESLLRSNQIAKAAEVIDQLLLRGNGNAYANLLKANLDFQQREFESALKHAEKAIQNGMDIKQAQIIAGTSALKGEDYERAYLYLSKAVNGLPSNHSAFKLLAHVQLMLGYTGKAKETLRSFDRYFNNDANLYSNTGVQLAKSGDLEGAKEFLVKASKANPKESNARLQEALIKLATKDDSALKNLETLIEEEPDSQLAWSLLALDHVEKGDTDSALELAKKYQNISSEGYVLEAIIYDKIGDRRSAEAALEVALDQSPNLMSAKRLQLEFLIENEDYTEAQHLVSSMLSESPNNMRLLTSLVRIIIDSESKDALSLLQQHSKKYNDALNPVLAEAGLYIQGNRPQAAIDTLNNYEGELNRLGLKLLGDSYLRLENFTEAKNAYEKWRNQSPGDMAAWLRSIATEELNEGVSEANLILEEAIKIFPESEELKLIKINYLTRLGRIKEARKSVEAYNSTERDEHIVVRLSGELALEERDYKRASELLKAHYKENPSFDTAIIAAKAMQFNGEKEFAAKILELEFTGQAQTSKNSHTLAEFYSFNGESKKAKSLYQRILEKNPNDFVALNNLAGAYLAMGEHEKAFNTAQKAYQLAPNIPQIQDTYGWAAFQVGDTALALKHLQTAYKQNPNAEEISLNLAEALISNKQYDEALKILDTVAFSREISKRRKALLLDKMPN